MGTSIIVVDLNTKFLSLFFNTIHYSECNYCIAVTIQRELYSFKTHGWPWKVIYAIMTTRILNKCSLEVKIDEVFVRSSPKGIFPRGLINNLILIRILALTW